MAVTQTSLTSGSSASNNTTYDTASISPSGNELVLLAIWTEVSVENDDAVPSSITGNGLTWVLVDQQAADNWSTITLYRAMGASPSSGAVTINFNDTVNGLLWQISEFAGIDTSGTNGSGAIVQSATNSGSGASLSVTLAAFGSANNATFGTFGAYADTGSAVSCTPGSGFAEIYDAEVNPDSWKAVLCTEWRDDNDTTVDVTYTQSDASAGIAVEIKELSLAVEQEGYRWRDDDGSESGATWLVAQDTATTVELDTNVRLRVLINATGDPDSSQYQLEARKSGGNWFKVE